MVGARTSPAPVGECKLFPSLCARRPAEVSGSSRRRQQRGRGHANADAWVNVIWALFTFLEGGSPYDIEGQERLARRAAQAPWTSLHEEFAGYVHEEISRFCRLRDFPALGRGVQKLSELIKQLRSSGYQHGVPQVSDMAVSAWNVRPERMSLPEVAGIVKPEDHLKGEHRRQFLNMVEEVPIGFVSNPTKPCFKVLPQDQVAVYKKLLDSGVACLLPEELALRDERGNLITGGLFAVSHKPLTDRIINDRRPLNETERRLVWAKLPHGTLLTQLILPVGCSIRGSGDDLANYFFLLRHRPEWVPRNAIGQTFSGEQYTEYGADADKRYVLSFTTVCMGDLNAVDIAQQTHLEILKDCGCMDPSSTLSYRSPVPPSHFLEGLYIDDHITVQILPNRASRLPRDKCRDEEVLAASRANYKALEIPTSSKKSFTKEPDFVAWGTQVSNQSGRVGAPLKKLAQISALIGQVLGLGAVSKKVMQQTLGLLIHPMMHQRCCMSVLYEAFSWTDGLSSKGRFCIPPGVREELIMVALLVPFLHTNIRWPISQRISATDASSTCGGRASTWTPQYVADTLFRFAVHHGEYVRLDWQDRLLVPDSQMTGASPEIENLMMEHFWQTTDICSFKRRQHINVLELLMIKRELVAATKNTSSPLRLVNLCDSRVALGSFGKGRSSSKQLNRILRSCIGWSLAGRKQLHNLWVRTDKNPSDFPSRHRVIPSPKPLSELSVSILGRDATEVQRPKSDRCMWGRALDSTPGADLRVSKEMRHHPAITHWTFREVFCGKPCLSQMFSKTTSFTVGAPIEAYVGKRMCPGHGFFNDGAFRQLLLEAGRGKQIWHFGLPRSCFSCPRISSQEAPLDSRQLRLQQQCNELLRRVLQICEVLVLSGSYFTFENPASSSVWSLPDLLSFGNQFEITQAILDQCQYGLQIRAATGQLGFARRCTRFWGNLPGLGTISLRCAGGHEHVQVIGGVRDRHGWVKRSTLAGFYPERLCHRYALLCAALFE